MPTANNINRLSSSLLSLSRMEYVAKIAAKGGTLEQAQKMGLRDSFVDYWFRNGAKKQEIKTLFDRLRSIATEEGASGHAESLLHYDALKNLLDSPEASWLKTSIDRNNNTWSYQMGFGDPKSADNVVVSYSNIPIEDAAVLTKFQEYKCLDAVVRQLGEKVGGLITTDAVNDFRSQLNVDFNTIDQSESRSSSGLSWQKIFKIQDRLYELGIDRDHRPTGAYTSVRNHLNIVIDFGEMGGKLGQVDFAHEPIGVYMGTARIADYQCASPEELVEALVVNARLTAKEAEKMLEAKSNTDAVYKTFQDMSDDEVVRAFLNKEADNPFFCKSNFQGFRDGEAGPDKFQAVFRGKDRKGEEITQTIDLSNRAPTQGEFRGSRLREHLETTVYQSLADLVRNTSGTADDSLLIMRMCPASNEFIKFFGKEGRSQGKEGHFHTDSSGFDLTSQRADQLYLQAQTTLASVPVTTRATFGQLWNWPDETLERRVASEAKFGTLVELQGTGNSAVEIEEFPFDIETPAAAPAPAQPSGLWHFFSSYWKHTDLNTGPLSKNQL